MYQLTPGEQYPLMKVLSDPSDSSTRYVQAVVRNALDNSLLATLRLEDLGSRRFRYAYDVPNVKYIYITFKVYTESGYTTLDGNEPIESREYIVEERWSPGRSGGGGGGLRLQDYRDMIREVIEKLPVWAALMSQFNQLARVVSEIDIPEAVSLKGVEGSLVDIAKQLSSIPTEKGLSKADIADALKGVGKAVSDAHKAILEAIPDEQEPAEPVNLSPVFQAIEDLRIAIEAKFSEVHQKIDAPKPVQLQISSPSPAPEAPKKTYSEEINTHQKARRKSLGLA